MDNLQIQAIHASSDVEDFFETFILEDLAKEGDLREYISKIEVVKRNFRRTSSQLRVVEGENFLTKYPMFDEMLQKLNSKFKEAKSRLSEVHSDKVPNTVEPGPVSSIVTPQAEKERLRCTSNRKSFLEQATWELNDCVWEDIIEYDQIKSIISFFESRLDEFRKMCTDLDVWFADDVIETRFREKNANFIGQFRDKIVSGKARILELKKEHERIESERLEMEKLEKIKADSSRIALAKQEEEAKIKDILACAKTLHYEIDSRFESLKRKCLSMEKLKVLNVYEVLNLKKTEENLHTAHRELIDKVSSFETYVLPCDDLVTELRDKVLDIRDKCSAMIWDYVDSLDKIIEDRDISEQKLKNSAGLNIAMEKFKGYNSVTDVYTFRSEFRKLVEPEVRKILWADHLKKKCLAGAAYNLVAKIENIDDIWDKLTEVYGDTNLMLQNKLETLEKFSNLEKVKDDEKIVNTITSLLNVMSDLSKLALDYKLENDLYYGPGLHKILELLGRTRERKFIKSISSKKIDCVGKWKKLVTFLEEEVNEREAYVLNEKVKKGNLGKVSTPVDEKGKSSGFMGQRDDASGGTGGGPTCLICGKCNDHILTTDSNGKKHVEYVACKTFVDKSPHQRNTLLLKKRFCGSCLKPGVIWNSEHECDDTFVCKQDFVKDGVEKKCKKHVLVCGHHCDTDQNKTLLKNYKKKVITPQAGFQDFSKNVTISCFSESYTVDALPDVKENSVYAFQPLDVEGESVNMFYDNGCGDMILAKETADQLVSMGRAKQICPGPLTIQGVNGQSSSCPHGVYEIQLPLLNGGNATLSGLCVDNITEPFPFYPLNEVEKDFRTQIGKKKKGLVKNLPKLPEKVGGKVGVMIGKAYLKYFPKEIGRLESGLTLYRSMFKGLNGTTGVISGPHPEFSRINRTANFVQGSPTYYCQDVQNYLHHLSRVADVPLLGYQKPFNAECTRNGSSSNTDPLISFSMSDDNGNEFDDAFSGGRGSIDQKVYTSKRGPKCLKTYERIEKTGTEVSYRCMECRNCKECLRAGLVEEISFVDEAQQDVINKSVTVDINNKITSASLPFIANPDSMLADNSKSTLKVYHSQVKRLNKSEKDRVDVLEAEKKLQDLGFVDWFHNLSKNDQEMIENSNMHFLAWQIAWSKSVTTPVRPVFNASLKTYTGYSLNDIIAKGSNNMNNLVEMLIRWQIKIFGYHSDIRKMYNTVLMNKDHWRYQLYWWSDTLKPDDPPLIKFIKTCIYGIKSSGNQAERALRMVVDLMSEQYPMAADIVNNDVYVDDCISGEMTHEETLKATDELKLSLGNGNFTLKGITFSGEDPDVTLSEDGKSVKTGGLIWFPKEDYIMLNIGDLNFAKKICGRKIGNKMGLPEKLTLTHCASMVAQVFDPLGKAVPVTAGFKVDRSYLQRDLKLSWDDPIPENLRGIWVDNFEMLQELGQLKYKRVVVPPNAKNLDIVTLEAGDASKELLCAAIYARFECKDGSYSCQLVFARSKIVPEGMTIPRAELLAASTLAATSFTVQRALGSYHTASIKVSDSMVALHWIAAQRKMLKVWVRGHVMEINRLSELSTWSYVESSKNPADLGTRKGVKVAEIAEGSVWINGMPWMRRPEEEFPTVSINDIRLCPPDMIEAEKEKIVLRSFHCRKTLEMDSAWAKQIKLRYKYSKYLMDPNRFRFRKVVRIVALVLEFIKKISKNIRKVQNNSIFNHKVPGDIPHILRSNWDKYVVTTGSNGVDPAGLVLVISQTMLQTSFYYFALKASEEVKKFLDKSKYEDISKEIDGVLYYSGRILPEQDFGGHPNLCRAALDLCQTTFCVPVMDRCSPVAISIALEIHWFHPDVSHLGIETVHRQTLKVAHIISGMRLATSIKFGCKRCRTLNKKSIAVAMGPVQDVNLCIAPAFYASQVDVFGPFKAFSIANKRAVIKVWFLIFCCCTTGAIDIKTMEDYSTDSFALGFIRFSCRFGYPRYLLPDPGSQLIKGCEDMSYSFVDAKQRLLGEFGVDYMSSPVGAHYNHGKVERKIREVKKCVQISVENERLSIVQWETLMSQIGNSINNLPIGLGTKVSNIESLDLITPNRLILGRNNDRCGNSPLVICPDHKKIIEKNSDIFRAWFQAWITSYVPTLIERPKWHKTDRHITVGDIVLFLKSEKEFDLQYQYGMVSKVYEGKDKLIRRVDVEYQNSNEEVKRSTQRGVRDLVIVHSVEELDIYETLHEMFDACE